MKKGLLKKQFLQLILALLLLNQCLVVGQDQIIQKTILMQQNEQHYLDLNSFYSGTIQDIILPASSTKLESIPPSQITSSSQEAPTMNQVLPTSFPVNNSQKNVVSVVSEANAGQVDYFLVFGNIVIQNKAAKSQELTRVNFLTTPSEVSQIFTSMHSSNQGFVYMLKSDNSQNIYIFTFSNDNDKPSLSIKEVASKDLLYSPKSIIQNNKIYIYTVNKQFVSQYSFDSSKYTIGFISSLSFQCDAQSQIKEVNNINNFFIIQSCNDAITFYTIGSQQYLQYYNVYINQSTKYQYRYSQVVNNNIYLTLLNDKTLQVCQLELLNQTISLKKCQIQDLNQQFTNAVFVSNSLLLLSNKSTLALFDFSSSNVIYQQSAAAGNSFSFYNFLNNQVLLTINQGSPEKYYQTQSIQFASPAIIINGENQSITFSITVGPIPLVYQGTVNVQVVTSPQYTFSTPAVNLGATFYGQVYDNSYVYYFPIEDYVTGQNLSLNFQPDDASKNLITKVEVIQFKGVDFTSTWKENNGFTAHQLYQQPYHSLLVLQQSDNQYQISYAKIVSRTNEIEMSYPINNGTLDSPIDLVDESGCFTLKSDSNSSSKRIFVPSINNLQRLYMNILQVNCDTTTNSFQFSSDLQTGDILVMCGPIITHYNYLGQFSDPYNVAILNQVQLQGFADYNRIMCLDGRALIISKTFITAYDYVSSILIGVPVEIPQLEESQTIVFFKSSFFILFFQDNNDPKINQYSYSNFSSSQAQLLRTLEFGEYSPAISTQPIALHSYDSNKYDYLLVAISGNGNKYYTYRVNHSWSQNQLFGVTTVQNALNIFSGDIICILGQNLICQQILQSAKLTLQFNFSTSSYQNNIHQKIVFTASPKTQVNVNDAQTQTYGFFLRRDTSAENGIVNLQATSIQALKTSIQDGNTKITDSTELIFQDGTDPSIFNANLIGWDLEGGDGEIVNRLIRGDTKQSSTTTFIILYDQPLLVSSVNFAINTVIIQDKVDYTKCVGLEDSSQTIYDDTTTQLNLYFLCQQKIDYYQIKLTKNGQSYASSTIRDKKSYPLSSTITQPSIYIRIFSSQTNDLRLYTIDRNVQTQITIDASGKQATVTPVVVSSSLIISQNIISGFNNLILKFQMNGSIFTTSFNNDDANNCSLFNIKNLLNSFHFIVQDTDSIQQVRQISDKVFLFQFAESYIYKVTFNYQNDSKVLGIASVYSYDYKEGFTSLIGYYSGNNYTLLVGQLLDHQVIVNLYNNNYQKENCNLINSWSLNSYEEGNILVNAIGFNSQTNEFDLFLSNSSIYQLYLHSNTSIILSQSQISKKTFSISPKFQDTRNNIINFSLTQGGKKSFSGMKTFMCLSIIIICLFLF